MEEILKVLVLEKLIADIKADTAKCVNKGNQAAGLRARKNIQDLKLKAHELRGLLLTLDHELEGVKKLKKEQKRLRNS